MKVKLLQQRHPSYDEAQKARQSALYEGGQRWEDLLEVWFPKRHMEPGDVRAERLGLAHYINYTGNILASLASMLFAESPSISGADGDYYSELLRDADQQGTAWAEFWRARFLEACVQQTSWVWVNLPRRVAPAVGAEAPTESAPSLGAELAAGQLDAFLVGLAADQVIDWGEDDRGRLAWVMLHDVVSRRAGPESPRVRVFRWTFVSATTIQRWEWASSNERPSPTPEDVAEKVLDQLHNMGGLPVIRVRLPILLWPMGRLEGPAIALTRSENDLHWALHQAANELLTVTSKWGDKAPEALGHGHFLKLERDADGEDAAAYVSPSGVAFEHLERQVERLRDDLHRVVSQMAQAAASNATRARMSGESKNADWRAAEVLLAAYAGLMTDAMAKVLAFIARLRGDSDAIEVGGLDGWHQVDLESWLGAAAMATEAHQLSPTFRRVVARGQSSRVLQDVATPEELEAINAEIEAADVEVGPLFAAATVPAPKDYATE